MGLLGGGARKGYWSFRSETDTRWNSSGDTVWSVAGGICPQARAWLDKCKKKYGKQPDDLEYSFMKD